MTGRRRTTSSYALLAALACSGCIIETSTPPERPPNSAPTILAVSVDQVELPQFSTVVVPSAGALSILIGDADLGDTLYVRIFVEYNHPDATPPRSECMADARTATRTAVCRLEGVCQQGNIGQDPLPLLQVFVFDRAYDPNALPLYQGVAADGLSASQTFFLRCQEPSQ